MNEETQVSQDNAPATNDSDFGVDASVYNDPVDTAAVETKAPETNVVEDQAVAGDEKALNEGQVDPESMVEIAKGMALKAGDKLTADHINQLKRGAYREADYTRKTQELAQARNQANEVLQAREAVLNNPQALRQFLQDEHILKAFHPNELLVNGLQAAGIPPDVWNKFLDEYQGAYGAQPQANNWQANPLAKDIHTTRAEIQKLQARLQNFEVGQQRGAQERAEHEARVALQNEVKEAVTKFKDVTEEEILEAIAAGRQGTADQIAAMISKRYSQRISQRDQALLEQKKRQQPTAPKGTSVPVLPKRPTTWDEASTAASAFISGGQN